MWRSGRLTSTRRVITIRLLQTRREIRGDNPQGYIRELFAAVRDGSLERDQVREKFQAISKETNEKTLGLLSADQKEKLEKMKGKKFEFDRRQLFGRRRQSNN